MRSLVLSFLTIHLCDMKTEDNPMTATSYLYDRRTLPIGRERMRRVGSIVLTDDAPAEVRSCTPGCVITGHEIKTLVGKVVDDLPREAKCRFGTAIGSRVPFVIGYVFGDVTILADSDGIQVRAYAVIHLADDDVPL